MICAYCRIMLFLFVSKAACTRHADKEQAAIQYPSEIKAEAGSSAQIYCIHSLPKLDDSNSLVYWSKSYPSSNQVMSLRGNHILHISDEFQGRVQAYGEISYNISLLLKNLSVNDSGVYICEVVKTSPPPTRMQKGNGTFITVTEADYTTSSLQLTSRKRQSIFTVTNICVVGGLSVFLLVTIILLGVLLYARVRRHRSLLQLSAQCQERDKSSFLADLKENMYVDGTMEDTIHCDVYQELIITKTPVYDTLLVKSSNQDHH
ncbi:sodium channel subunit beta-3-like isoform X2 [Polypterus senegalus]|uniref:sodium channel subunit beta-3-like isoform X2 n=1 Tax=Polypterus senegalus TaxID=55291 RepID=UPI0019655F4B|nr:sodium channel subunit beta-3-like isoform X2 [Polypterus senegalus]